MNDFVFHPNGRIRDIGKLFRRLKDSPEFASQQIRHIFDAGGDWKLCDAMPLLHVMSMSTNERTRKMLSRNLKRKRIDCQISDIRENLQIFYNRVTK